MAVTNASLGALGVARDNHAGASTTTALATDEGITTIQEYEVTAVTVAGNINPYQDDVEAYTLTLTGGDRRAELQSSGRTNVTWSVSSGNSLSNQSNTGATVTWYGSFGAAWVKAVWNDTFNTQREHTLNVTIQ